MINPAKLGIDFCKLGIYIRKLGVNLCKLSVYFREAGINFCKLSGKFIPSGFVVQKDIEQLSKTTAHHST